MIYNCCDGFELAQKTSKKGISEVIFIPEPYPDDAAREFIKQLLKGFSKGLTLHLAVKNAQKYIRPLLEKYPGTESLIGIFQNSTASYLSIKAKNPVNPIAIGGTVFIFALGLIFSLKQFSNKWTPGFSLFPPSSSYLEKSNNNKPSLIDEEARLFTVSIKSDKPGSGVIFAKGNEGKKSIYFVLTSKKVAGISSSDEVEVITHDNKIYKIKKRFPPLKSLNLAILSFESQEEYKYVKLGDFEKLKKGSRIYIFGSSKIMNSKRYYSRFASGEVSALFPNEPAPGGYTFIYTGKLNPIMEGGPILDENHCLVAMHDGNREKVEMPEIGDQPIGEFNLGIDINTIRRTISDQEILSLLQELAPDCQ